MEKAEAVEVEVGEEMVEARAEVVQWMKNCRSASITS